MMILYFSGKIFTTHTNKTVYKTNTFCWLLMTNVILLNTRFERMLTVFSRSIKLCIQQGRMSVTHLLVQTSRSRIIELFGDSQTTSQANYAVLVNLFWILSTYWDTFWIPTICYSNGYLYGKLLETPTNDQLSFPSLSLLATTLVLACQAGFSWRNDGSSDTDFGG